jgi:hypothetical protein
MRKFVWIPVVSLGPQTPGQFLEIMSEPACFGGINMDALKNCGLDKNIAETQAILKQLTQQPNRANLYLTRYLVNLSNTQGVNLGLTLASFIQAPTCPYQKVIVTGQLQLDATQASLSIATTGHFEAKIQTILNLGAQSDSIPFYFPRAMITESNATLLSQLPALNIVLKPIDNLSEIFIDFGLSLN